MAAVIPNPLAPLRLSQHMADLPVGETFVCFVRSAWKYYVKAVPKEKESVFFPWTLKAFNQLKKSYS